MEVIKQEMAKEQLAAAPPVAPHAPAHGILQPSNLLAAVVQNNNVEIDLRKAPRPTSGILRHPNLAAPS